MTLLTIEQIEIAKKAGQMIKVLHLANMAGMDEIAIKLNCELTYKEEKEAVMWATALRIAAKSKVKLFDQALILHEYCK